MHEPVTRPRRCKIFAVGLSRTGTTSLAEALRMLGYRSEHFPCDEVTRVEIGDFLAAPAPELRLSVLENVDALLDTPVTATYRALDRAYPGSRFILTLRDKESWLDSCEAYWRTVLRPNLFVQRWLDRPNAAYVEQINRAVYGMTRYDRSQFSAVYDKHVADVHEYFASRLGDLLVMNVAAGDGWQSLCAFLGTTPPQSTFPWMNTRPSPNA